VREGSDGMTALVTYDKARNALEKAATVDEAESIKDQAVALKAYARQRRNIEMYAWLTEIELRARRRIGELSKVLEKGRPGPKSQELRSTSGTQFKTEALKAAGLSRTEAHRDEKISDIPEYDFEKFIAEKKVARVAITADEVSRLVSKMVRRRNQEKVGAEAIETCQVKDLQELIEDGKQFKVIYADPPWKYSNQATRASTDNHYKTMSVEEICALPIEQLADAECHLHLWTTNAFLRESFRVIEAWGFEYKSCFVWVKPKMGIGNYWRVSHEFLMLGVRGSLSFLDHSKMSWAEMPRDQHSKKPFAIRKTIEVVSPTPRLELFAREISEGWTCWPSMATFAKSQPSASRRPGGRRAKPMK